ncbi:hypothetical protein Tco_1251317 [Tanacetum coccineum]
MLALQDIHLHLNNQSFHSDVLAIITMKMRRTLRIDLVSTYRKAGAELPTLVSYQLPRSSEWLEGCHLHHWSICRSSIQQPSKVILAANEFDPGFLPK